MQMPKELDKLAGRALGKFQLPAEVSFTVVRAEGLALFSTEGRVYRDYVLGRGPMVLGHSYPRVVEAICRQATLGTHFYAMNEVAPRLAAEICRFVPCAESVRFVSDGSEATFYALRLARAFTGRTKILKFAGAYHGHHDYAQFGGKPGAAANDGQAEPDSAGVPRELGSMVVNAPFNDLEAVRNLVGRFSNELAAIIVEPVQRGLLPSPGFLEGLRALCDGRNILLIFDEVVTGFRLAMGGAQELYGVTPDLCTLGKVIGGGLPLGAVAGRRDIMELVAVDRPNDGRSAYVAGTLNGNPLSCAAGLATLEVLTEVDGPTLMRKAGERLARGLLDAAERLSIPCQMLGLPSFQEPIFDNRPLRNLDDYTRTNRGPAQRLGVELVKQGFFVVPGGRWNVSILHDADEVDAICEAAFAAMRIVRDEKLID